ncbi:hypothetical protein LOAG_13390 [Loa loa]|uniref:Very-long-chain 3-oxoacyl-CoA synthase n=1 Tax=Loa loa TaxID=7209 RepID=A0A1S0TJK9_LOALO|nr:hypothetical protein LOAG_13390 [Loa loa]EFO15123.1 hypothetical protein LOAG_13390 [Loa loa]
MRWDPLTYDAQLSIEWIQQRRPLFILLFIAYTLFVFNMPRIWKRKKKPRLGNDHFLLECFQCLG